jgi:hypothetical protein
VVKRNTLPQVIFSSFLISLGLLLSAGNIFAQEPQTAASAPNLISSTIDWETGILSITVEEFASRSSYNRPAALFGAEQAISREITQLVFRAILDIQADSHHRLADLAREERDLLRTLEEISETARLVSTQPGEELNSVTSTYQLKIYPAISSILVRHSTSFPMEDVLSWQAGSEYTGIVIYAGRELPVHGEPGSGEYLAPSLFPVIYDENMRLLVDRNRMDPDFAARWGAALFSRSFDEAPHRDRIGENPFRIIATGLFGVVPSDPKIPSSDADVLLHSESGRRLLREGRILIIYRDPPPEED